MFKMIKELVKTAFYYEIDGEDSKRLVYDPFLFNYFKENNLDFKKKLVELLLKTKFTELIKLNKQKLKELISCLKFNRKMIFDYKKGAIEYK